LDKYNVIVCCNPSTYIEQDDKPLNKNHIQWQDGHGDDGFYYTPGAADDHETWARGLTPELFWIHEQRLTDLSSLTEVQVDAIIDEIVKTDCQDALRDTCSSPQTTENENANKIGKTNLWIGSRRAGRPPECWDSFDAILNVTENEYPNMIESIETSQKPCFYLQVVVAEGKRDKTQLERLLPLGLAFLLHHIQQGRRTLVHCAQGKDRSVALAVAFVALCCPTVHPLGLNPRFEQWDIQSLCKGEVSSIEESDQDGSLYDYSGLPLSLIRVLLNESARDEFLRWCHSHSQVPTSSPLATKESIRIGLHLIQQDREVADPTRSTMQKLNRFFMSGSMYR
jgi:tRNA A64-2'-O-ribosylphosphate transferase